MTGRFEIGDQVKLEKFQGTQALANHVALSPLAKPEYPINQTLLVFINEFMCMYVGLFIH